MYYHGEPFRLVRSKSDDDNGHDPDVLNFRRLMRAYLYNYDDMTSFFGLYMVSYRLEIFIEASMKEFARIKKEHGHLKCKINGDCNMMKEDVPEDLNLLKEDVIKVKDIGYFNAHKMLAQVLSLPIVVVDLIFKHFVEDFTANEDKAAMYMDDDVDEDFTWLIEDHEVIANTSDDGDRFVEPYNFVNFVMDEEANLYKNLAESRRSLYHDPLIDQDSWKCLKKYTAQLNDYLNKN